MSCLRTAVPTLRIKKKNKNKCQIQSPRSGGCRRQTSGALDGPEDARMLYFPPGSLPSCKPRPTERGSTWSGPTHFLRGAQGQDPWGRWGMGEGGACSASSGPFQTLGRPYGHSWVLTGPCPVLGSVSRPFSWVISGRQ